MASPRINIRSIFGLSHAPRVFDTNGGSPLKGLTNLKDLNLYRTQVTDAGVADLQKALPNLVIER